MVVELMFFLIGLTEILFNIFTSAVNMKTQLAKSVDGSESMQMVSAEES